MEQPVKVAMPAATGSVVPLVQERLPAAGLVPIARVMTVVLSVVTTLLLMSRTATRGCWAQTAPAGRPPGWVMNARWLATIPVTVKAVLMTDAPNGVVATSWYPAPGRLIAQPAKTALP